MSITEIDHINATVGTINQTILISATKEVVKVDRSNTRTKEGISVSPRSCVEKQWMDDCISGFAWKYTCGSISQLSTGNIGIID